MREALLGQWTATTQLQEVLAESVPLLCRGLALVTENDSLPLFAIKAMLTAVRLDLNIQSAAVGQARDLVH